LDVIMKLMLKGLGSSAAHTQWF